MLPGISAWLAAAVILLSPGRSKESRNSTDQTLYLGVVYSRVDPGLQRTLERALGSAPFRPLYLQLESGLGQMCTALAGRRMAGGLVFTGTGASTAVIALSAMGLPVLWVGGTAFHQEELGPTVVRVGPGLPEAARALRSLLTAWRWHSYTLLWAGPPPGQATLNHLLRHPLSPTVHHLAPPFKRVLSRVSHSGRGIIALAGGRSMVRPILEVATQLGLTDGNYVWLWLDTAGNSRLDTSAVRRARSLIRPVDRLPVGLLRLRAGLPPTDRHLVRASVRLLLDAARRAASKTPPDTKPASCWAPSTPSNFTIEFVKELRKGSEEAVSGGRQGNDSSGRALSSRFQILNLIPRQQLQNATPPTSDSVQMSDNWKQVGEIVGCCDVRLERIIWPGGNIGGPCGGSRTVIKVVTAVAAPFVMISETARGIEGACMRGLPCHVVGEYNGTRYTARVSCCYGLAMDLLEAVAEELEFDFYLYMVPDASFGTKQVDPTDKSEKWSGVVADLMNGHAHMAFTALSITRPRSDKIDFSTPFYYSGTSFLAAPNQRTDIPLLAFLLPFSPELWIAIFTSLNVTAVAVAIYEWLSPFGLNPWGRQRTKNFSMSSALWVCWGLLCGHLVAFKAPKSWPNKFLINVWGGFSVIFVASYTANIAALIAGLFFHSATASPNDHSLLSQRVAAPQGSATEYYVRRVNKLLWEHMRRIKVPDVAVGVQMLKNGSLDILIADTPILDYYRATDSGCELQKIGDAISNEDMYAVGMIKGFPLKDSISSVISKFTTNGFMDILQKKWYGELACFTIDHDMSQPRPLGVSAVAGVFLLLGLGVVVGIIILILEHLFYKYTLPILRHKPKGTIWRSRNIMFFSQKLYRFINCVELVSPHHAARELVHTIRQGQITSLFQKSVKRKEHEQRRRRKSKAQFFEMIQEIRRVQQEEKQNSLTASEADRSGKQSPRMKKCKSPQLLSPPIEGSRRMSRLPSRLELARRFSKDVFRSKSSGNLSLRRMSSDINFAASRFLECHSSQAIGRRLSRDTNPSPPDINSRRESHLLTPEMSIASAAELDAGPRSPFLLPPEIAVHPPPAGHRFSYVDTGNPAFRERLARFTGEQRSGSEDIEERRRNAPSLLEQITTMQEQFPNKPKVVSVLPKNRSASEITLRHDTSPLERLSREELVGLSEYPETELKRRVLDALKDKDPT